MGIRIIESNSDTDSYAVLYCSTSMWAFGPVFEDREQAEEFLKFVPGDPRLLDDVTLEGYYSQFLAREKEDEPPPALKLEMERDLKGAVAMGKVWGEVFDNLFSPKAK